MAKFDMSTGWKPVALNRVGATLAVAQGGAGKLYPKGRGNPRGCPVCQEGLIMRDLAKRFVLRLIGFSLD